ncbi:MAG TPA: VWA domain-containing protein [Candidatus Acidoferrales bacterium]|nr:VWA domain-containing protein [Candidatus Acidoferrales bacterium]
MKRLAIVFLSALLAPCVIPVSALAQSGEARTTIPLVVMNQSGQIIQGLTPQNLRIKGAKASVRNIALDTSPRRIILLLDMSGSMGETIDENKHITTWDYTKDMARVFLKTIFAQDSVALDVFADKEKQVVPFTHDFTLIRAAIDALPKPRGFTRAGDALQSALRDFGQTAGFGDSIVFFSDGQFQSDGSRTTVESQGVDVGRCAVRVFLIFPMTTNFDPYPPDLMPNIESVIDFMDATGGFSFAPKRFPDDWPTGEIILSDPFQRIAALSNAIHGTYRLELQFAQPPRKKQKLQAEILDDRKRAMHGVYVLYPHTLYPSTNSGRH